MAKTAVLLALLLCTALTSCLRDGELLDRPAWEGLPVSIAIGAGTRAGAGEDIGAAVERSLTSLRVLAFRSPGSRLSPGTLAYNQKITTDENGQIIVWEMIPNALEEVKTVLEIETGTYDFVFIANESGGWGSVSPELDGLAMGSARLSDLRDVIFPSQAFAKGSVIPMTKLVTNVRVYGDDDLEVPGIGRITAGGLNNGVWPVSLERVGVRLDLTLTLTELQSQSFAAQSMTLAGRADGARLLPGNETFDLPELAPITLSWDYASPDNIVDNGDGTLSYAYGSVILPERVLWGTDNVAANAMTLTWDGKSGPVYSLAGDGATRDYSLPRNLFLRLDARVNKNETLVLNAVVLPWGDGGTSGFNTIDDGTYFLKVNSREFGFSHGGGEQPLTITTDHPTGWSATVTGSTSWISVTPSQGTPGNSTPSITVEENPGGVKRTATIVVVAGNMHMEILVVQDPAPGVLAPPGVLGVGVESGRLTLRGSKEFAGTEVEWQSDFGPLTDETVYVALFKWGSLVGTSTNLLSADFDSGQVVWTPPGFPATISAWGDIPYADGGSFYADNSTFPANDAAAGLGDPCAYADRGTSPVTWIMPSGAGSWSDFEAADLPYQETVAGVVGRATNDYSMFLPVAGYRSGSGLLPPDRVGQYWSRGMVGTAVRYLDFDDDHGAGHTSYLNLSETANFAIREHGMAVRCVRETP